MNTRRKLILSLGAAALAAPFAAFAQQQGKVWRVGFLSLGPRPASFESDYLGAFPLGMRDLGYVEGRNLAIEWRFADARSERLPALAAELVELKVDAIVAAGTQAVSAARKASATIPIVMATVGDPVGSGLIASLARPGGNVTGTSLMAVDIITKYLELLRGMAPKVSRVAAMMNTDNPPHATALKNLQDAAGKTGVTILPYDVRTPAAIEPAFAQMKRAGAGAVFIFLHPIFTAQVRQIGELALKHRLPSISGIREFAEAGGLVTYGSSFSESTRRTAAYVDKILKGAKPSDLPVEQPVKFEMIINGRTAKALGLTIPQALLISADRVIE
ncbi:MAG: ABC transporter substrate-binding protein [Betaproteobacteria bacterium]|nr:ABC transporter substrate-binding protein [Betaproteobacteria bacterium]